MDRPTVEHGASLRVYPNIRTAARMVGVDPSTLSRRGDLNAERRGERDRALPATEVLRLAAIYRKRSLNEVAQDLIDHAREAASQEEAARVEEEIEGFFEGRVTSDEDRERFLGLARRLLPASLYKDVETTVSEGGKALPEALIGNHPLPDL